MTTRAAHVLRAVRECVAPPDEANGGLQVLDSGTEGDDTVCVVYRGWRRDHVVAG